MLVCTYSACIFCRMEVKFLKLGGFQFRGILMGSLCSWYGVDSHSWLKCMDVCWVVWFSVVLVVCTGAIS